MSKKEPEQFNSEILRSMFAEIQQDTWLRSPTVLLSQRQMEIYKAKVAAGIYPLTAAMEAQYE